MLSDVKQALRQLLRAPGFTATAVITLALGIGANTAIFSVVNAVLRHPAGVDHPEQVAVLHTRYRQFTLDVPDVSVPMEALAAGMHDQVAGAALGQLGSFNIFHDGRAEHLTAARVGWQWFQVFGARPIVGRTFTSEEDQANAGPVAVISYELWQRVFGGQAEVAGKTILLNNTPYRVVGVMRSDFAWPRGAELWVPMALPPSAWNPTNAFNETYHAVARLQPGVAVTQFSAAWGTQAWAALRRGEGSKFAASAGWGVYAAPLTEYAAGPLRTPLFVLSGLVGLVLLIAAANVAGLLLARSSARSREFAIRTALGASAGRVVRQLLVETLLLAGGAAVVGVLAGPLLGRVLLRLVPHDLARGYAVGFDPGVMAFTAGAAVLAALVAGMGPAITMLRRRKRLDLHEGGRSGTASAEKQRMRGAFVVGEVAAAFFLLAGAGLFLASLAKLQKVDPGFNPHGVEAANVQYAGQDLEKNQARQATFVGGVIANLAAQPGVSAAAAVNPLPFDPEGGGSCSFGIIGRPQAPNDPGPHSQLTLATPDYLQVMQIPLLAGRWFNPSDGPTSEHVTVIDERLAKKYWPGESPIGQHISFQCGDRANPAVIVGVVATVRLSSLEEDTSDGMRYYPFAQGTGDSANFLVRTGGDPAQMAAMLKRAVVSVDGAQAVATEVPVERLVEDSLAGRRLIVEMLEAFAGLALLLAVVGIYGLISYVTAQRTNEVGVRMALGARRVDVVKLILKQALLLVALGLAIGAVLAAAAAALLRHAFAGFGGGVASSLVMAAAVMLAVGVLAGAIPALRAASIDPMQALRME
ncbi:MAG TPA: ABC transporter permease [Acidobacteriaceae bacterium]|jgi:predicted permease|nr:ABC transporter permease [Acidobacteriaceae bacterium]